MSKKAPAQTPVQEAPPVPQLIQIQARMKPTGNSRVIPNKNGGSQISHVETRLRAGFKFETGEFKEYLVTPEQLALLDADSQLDVRYEGKAVPRPHARPESEVEQLRKKIQVLESQLNHERQLHTAQMQEAHRNSESRFLRLRAEYEKASLGLADLPKPDDHSGWMP